uniref:Uncharacterized protein n=1 Tax=Oryza punctata TaxID=4537 RepID=A0A0E0MH54_ORYPU
MRLWIVGKALSNARAIAKASLRFISIKAAIITGVHDDDATANAGVPEEPKVVRLIDGEEVVVPDGKDQRRPFSISDEDISYELRESVRGHEARQDKFVACQAMIWEHRHDEKGYAIVDNEFQVRLAIAKAFIPFPERYAKEEARREVTDMDGDLNSSN